MCKLTKVESHFTGVPTHRCYAVGGLNKSKKPKVCFDVTVSF